VKCKLCLNGEARANSHIVSKFFFKPMKEESGKFFFLEAGARKREFKLQDGPKQPMLCYDCEQKIGRWENYWRHVIFSRPGEGNFGFRIEKGKVGIHITGLDYPKFKLCQMSILWRAHESDLDCFREVNLGHHAERIREMILNEDPGTRTQYGCFLAGVLEKEGKMLTSGIVLPERIRVDGHICYRALIGGLFWFWVVSSHSDRLRHAEHLIGPEGELEIPFRLANDIPFFGSLGQAFKEAGLI
jgi:hypothetical protein